ncbi:MAG: hypothetical protein ACXW1M_09995 [Acidimicrobiia bacterium]
MVVLRPRRRLQLTDQHVFVVDQLVVFEQHDLEHIVQLDLEHDNPDDTG